jgi:hypothetical protein
MLNYLYLICFLISSLCYSQKTGDTPWENCFGKNASCKAYPKNGSVVGCSKIKVSTSRSSPVMAIVKRNGKVVKHAYISVQSSYSFDVPDGAYEVFFYYGRKWNSHKKMNSDECSSLYGGFTENESVTKDNPITLNSQTLTYTLTSVTNGNFSPKSSSLNEAL